MTRTAPSAVLRSALALGLLLAAGCESTGLRRVSFAFRVGGLNRPDRGPLAIEAANGWRVRLREARLALGPVYLNIAPQGAPVEECEDPEGGGRVVGQVLRRVVVDALAPDLVDVGPGEGVSEPALTADLWLLPPESADQGGALPGGAVAYVVGEAERGADRLAFAAHLPLDRSMAGGKPLSCLRAARRVPVCPQPVDQPLEDGGVMELRVDPAPWLRTADFADLLSYPEEGGLRTARPEDSVVRSLLNGVRLGGLCFGDGGGAMGGTGRPYLLRWVPQRPK